MLSSEMPIESDSLCWMVSQMTDLCLVNVNCEYEKNKNHDEDNFQINFPLDRNQSHE